MQTDAVLIKFNDIEKVIDYLVKEFGFSCTKKITQSGVDNYDIFNALIKIEIYDSASINEFTTKFLEQNNLEEANAFYREVNLLGYDIWGDMVLLDNTMDRESYQIYIRKIFSGLSGFLNSEVVLNINEQDFFLYNNSELESESHL